MKDFIEVTYATIVMGFGVWVMGGLQGIAAIFN